MNIKNEAQKKSDEKLLNDPLVKFDKEMMEYQIDALKQKAEIMEKEILMTTKSYAHSISELKQKVIILDSMLAEKKR